MKDLYTFDVDLESAKLTYLEIHNSYDKIFRTLGIEFVKGICINFWLLLK